ncbi:MAG: FixH family protein [Candidatus Cyclobacteriaceae bacterium M2_1C_046]
MKWNWGTKIILSFVGFAIFIIYLVVMSFRENIDLVTEDYYGEELKYEQRLSQMDNVNGLDNKVIIIASSDSYTLTFPHKEIKTGDLHFYRPDNKAFDRNYDLKGSKGTYTVSKADLIPGRYRVKISWGASGKKFYQEELIFVK